MKQFREIRRLRPDELTPGDRLMIAVIMGALLLHILGQITGTVWL